MNLHDYDDRTLTSAGSFVASPSYPAATKCSMNFNQ